VTRIASRTLLAGLLVALIATPPRAQETKPDPPRRLLEPGGATEQDAAVARALAWIAKQQKPDGSWAFDAGAMAGDRAAATGLALLPLIAADQTPRSGKYQKAVAAGLAALVKLQKPDGGFGNSTTGHAWAALALVEAFAATKDPALKGPAQKAVDALARRQGKDGGWPAAGDGGSDTVATARAVLAVRAAARAGLSVPEVSRGADRYLDALVPARNGYRSAYPVRPGGEAKPGTTATAAGLLVRFLAAGWGPNNPAMAEGADGLFKNPPSATSDPEYLLFATDLLHGLEGPEWWEWRPKLEQVLLKSQVGGEGPDRGSWQPDAGPVGTAGGRLATTCHLALALEVRYRHLSLWRKEVAKPPEKPDEPLELQAILPELVPLPEQKPDPKESFPGGNDPVRSAFPHRTGMAKAKLLLQGGGSDESEQAVARGLIWLAKQQKPDGGWVYDGSDKADTAAATGMALLPFLAAGHTHKAGEYQKTVKAGVEFLIRRLPREGPNAGKFTTAQNMYAQAIATLALCECYGMSKDKALLLPSCQAAINYIQRAQGANGSWGYQAGTTGDTSITGWQIQALHAARLADDIVVDDKVIRRAMQFLDTVSAGPFRSKYGYTAVAGAAPGTSLSAVGLWCRLAVGGWDHKTEGLGDGVAGLMQRVPLRTSGVPDTYFCHYATQVVRSFGGDEWRTWNEGPAINGKRAGGVRDRLTGLQVGENGPDHGSWDPDGGFIGRSCGRLGTTAMCVLALEVYYRYPPLMKQDNKEPDNPKP
jgi:hypothetical protein